MYRPLPCSPSPSAVGLRTVSDMRIHRIHADKDVANLSASSKLNAEWDYLLHLRDMGRKHAEKWLKENWDNVGEKSTFDLSCALAGSIRPVSRPFCEAAKSGEKNKKPRK